MALKMATDLENLIKTLILTNNKIAIVDITHPVGSVVIMSTTSNPNTSIGGTWVKLGSDRVLMTASSDSQLNTTVESGLPNITGSFLLRWNDNSGQGGIYNTWAGSLFGTKSGSPQGWSYVDVSDGGSRADTMNIDASRSNAIYGRSSIVQPPAIYCYMWRRTA